MGYSHMQKIGEHTWIYPCDAVKDRPNLGYIEGTNMALAVDAGHSSSHVMDFYIVIITLTVCKVHLFLHDPGFLGHHCRYTVP